MPYSVRWPNDDIQVVLGSITEAARERSDKWDAYDKALPMLRAVLVDCIDTEANSPKIKGFKPGRLHYYNGWDEDGRANKVWLTMAIPKTCERNNPAIERLLKWTLHCCVLWSALVNVGYDNIERQTMGEIAAHLYQFECAGYKAAKHCRTVIHSMMITEVLPWKVNGPRRVKFKTSSWVPSVWEILKPEEISVYADPYDRVNLDEILNVADDRVVIKFAFTHSLQSTTDYVCAIVIASIKELDSLLMSVWLDLANDKEGNPT